MFLTTPAVFHSLLQQALDVTHLLLEPVVVLQEPWLGRGGSEPVAAKAAAQTRSHALDRRKYVDRPRDLLRDPRALQQRGRKGLHVDSEVLRPGHPHALQHRGGEGLHVDSEILDFGHLRALQQRGSERLYVDSKILSPGHMRAMQQSWRKRLHVQSDVPGRLRRLPHEDVRVPKKLCLLSPVDRVVLVYAPRRVLLLQVIE